MTSHLSWDLRTGRWGLAAAVILWVSAAATGAVAGENDDRQQFERHVTEASELSEQGDYQGAIEELEQARDIIDHPRITMAIAANYLDWSRCQQADDEYEAVLEREELDEELRQVAEQRLEQLEEDCVQMASLRVDCTPADATVRVQSERLEDERRECPFEADVPVGDIELVVRADGFVTAEKTVEVSAGEDNRRQVELVAEPDPELQSEPEPDPVEEPSQFDWYSLVGLTSLGLSGGLLVAGAVSDYTSSQRIEEAAEAREQGNLLRLQQLEAEAQTARTRTIALYAGGGVLAAVGVTAWVLRPGPADEESEPMTRSFSMSVGIDGISALIRW